MRGDLTLKILEAIFKGTTVSANIFLTIVTSGYGASRSRLDFNFDKRQRKLDEIKDEIFSDLRKKQKFYNMLSKLKREGIIERSSKNRGWDLTVRGLKRLEKLRKRLIDKELLIENYPKIESHELIIFTFDIPEKQRLKRNWLRRQLLDLGFTGLQKSVLIGKIKLPKDFMHRLRDLDLLEYVEILVVTKTGTVKEFIKPGN